MTAEPIEVTVEPLRTFLPALGSLLIRRRTDSSKPAVCVMILRIVIGLPSKGGILKSR